MSHILSVSLQRRTFSVWALWIHPTVSPTPCTSMTSTTSNSGSTVYALRWPNNRGLHHQFSREKLSEPSAAPPPLSRPTPATRSLTRTARPPPALNSGLRRSPKPDWTRRYKAHWRGRRPECRHFTRPKSSHRFPLRRAPLQHVSHLGHMFLWIFSQPLFLCFCFIFVAALKTLSRSFPSMCLSHFSGKKV